MSLDGLRGWRTVSHARQFRARSIFRKAFVSPHNLHYPRYALQYPLWSCGIGWETHDLTVNTDYNCVVPVFNIAIGTPLVSRTFIHCTVRMNGFQSAFLCEFPFLVEVSSTHSLTTGW